MTQRDLAKMADLRAESARKDEVYKRHIERLRNDRKVKQMDTLFIGLAVFLGGAGVAFVIYAAAMFSRWAMFGF